MQAPAAYGHFSAMWDGCETTHLVYPTSQSVGARMVARLYSSVQTRPLVNGKAATQASPKDDDEE